MEYLIGFVLGVAGCVASKVYAWPWLQKAYARMYKVYADIIEYLWVRLLTK